MNLSEAQSKIPNDPQNRTSLYLALKSGLVLLRNLKWYQKVVMIIVAGFLFCTNYYATIHHRQETERNQAALAKITPKNIKSMTVRLWKEGDDKPIILTRRDCDELANYVQGMTPTHEIGAGKWLYFRGIDIDSGSVGQFRIVLMSRESLKGHTLASFQFVDGPKTTSTLYYDADTLWDWLKKLPSVAQQ